MSWSRTWWWWWQALTLSLLSLSSVCECRRFMERTTNYGRVRGLVETLQGGKRVEKYLGIPYARPPLGKLRFEVSDVHAMK
ncbi:hypothetical protein C0Q70_16005 [Pomacea canaliculata]|uniref:Carboxylesterase type B domain-containing protein n=1 Tax=Pomacea canaliculata TaxID=400727 RepID=A0A2T7NNK0_POMCA|nr:hypothetical protein C0Q70_16005 [Pomacea canaliculata]